MPHNTALASLLAIILSHKTLIDAIPVLTFPMNSQVPPVARVSEPFSFAFSASTFASSVGSISYSLGNQPTWLSFDGTTRLLSGIPTSKDIGDAIFQLIASDNDGSTNSSVTLVVLNTHGPQLGEPILPQLALVGQVSAPASLLFYPLQTFSFTFAQNTFLSTTTLTKFYAISGNNSPLPTWIQFDPEILRFSGITPPLVSAAATAQIYGINLVASDVSGFAEAVQNFQIIVGNHVFAFSDFRHLFHITIGRPFSTPSLRETLLLDGIEATSTVLTSIISNAPDWVKFDTDQIILSGKPPLNTTTTKVIITVTDAFGDVANVGVILEIDQDSMNLFTSSIPAANATIGQPFSYSLNATILRSNNFTLSADLGNCSAWLSFDSRHLTFHGKVPNDLQPGKFIITVIATDGVCTESRAFDLYVNNGHRVVVHSTTKLLTSNTKSAAPTSSPTSIAGSADGDSSLNAIRKLVKVVLATILPLLFLVLSACVLHQCIRKRRLGTKQLPNQSQSEIREATVEGSAHSEINMPEIGFESNDRVTRKATPTGPPRIELPWAPDSLRMSRDRFSKRLRVDQVSLRNSSWGDFVASNREPLEIDTPGPVGSSEEWNLIAQIDTPLATVGIPNRSQERPPLRLIQPRRHETAAKRASKAFSAISSTSDGLPQRMSGAGHGSGGFGQPQSRDLRASWQTSLASDPMAGIRRSIVVLGAIASSPNQLEDHEAATLSLDTERATVRLVPSDSTNLSLTNGQRQQRDAGRTRDQQEGEESFTSSWPPSQHSGSQFLTDATKCPRWTTPTSLRPKSGTNRRTTKQTCSPRSGIALAYREEPAVIQRSPVHPRLHAPSKLKREESVASSGQFDSAQSSDAEWEDENLLEEEDDEGQRFWHTSTKNEEGRNPSPRLPFKPTSTPQENVIGNDEVSPKSFRLADERRPVSVEKRDGQRTERSHQGSLRFV